MATDGKSLSTTTQPSPAVGTTALAASSMPLPPTATDEDDDNFDDYDDDDDEDPMPVMPHQSIVRPAASIPANRAAHVAPASAATSTSTGAVPNHPPHSQQYRPPLAGVPKRMIAGPPQPPHSGSGAVAAAVPHASGNMTRQAVAPSPVLSQNVDATNLRRRIAEEEHKMHALEERVAKIQQFQHVIEQEQDAFDKQDMEKVQTVLQQQTLLLEEQTTKVEKLKERLRDVMAAISKLQHRISRRQEVIEQVDSQLELLKGCTELCDYFGKRQAELTRAYEKGVQLASKMAENDNDDMKTGKA